MQAKKPAISVLTPVWNGMPFIKEAVDSVLNQDFQDWELVISDNGSTDGTRDYLKTLTDPRVRVFMQETNLGIDGNLNFLYSVAASDLAYCLCADDYFHKGTLASVVEEWKSFPEEVAFIVFNWKDVLRQKVKGKYAYDVLPRVVAPSLSQLAFLLFGNFPGNLSNISTRVRAIKDSGGFNESYKMAGDFEIWARIASTRSLALSDTQATYVRRHENTATNYMNKKGLLYNEQVIIYEELIDRLTRSGKFDRQQLIDYFNIEVNSFHYRESIKNILLGGRLNYLRYYLSSESKVFWPKWKRIFYNLPYAFDEKGRMVVLIKMAGQLMSNVR